MIILHKYCLKNTTSEAHYTQSAFINIVSKHDFRSLLHIISLYLIDQTYWVYKYNFRSLLHIISLYKYCLKNMTSEAYYI